VMLSAILMGDDSLKNKNKGIGWIQRRAGVLTGKSWADEGPREIDRHLSPKPEACH
jgi:hypothetical protein